jgi:hypothetical protein
LVSPRVDSGGHPLAQCRSPCCPWPHLHLPLPLPLPLSGYLLVSPITEKMYRVLGVVVVFVAAASRRLSNIDAISAVHLAYRRLLPLPEEIDARAEEILRRYPFIDGHADVPMQVSGTTSCVTLRRARVWCARALLSAPLLRGERSCGCSTTETSAGVQGCSALYGLDEGKSRV